MKRAGIAIILIAALVTVSLAGCGGNGGSSGGQSPSTSVQGGPADLGQLSLGSLVPRGALSLRDGVAAFGQMPAASGATSLPAVVRSLGGKKWQVTTVGDKPYQAQGAVSLGKTLVLVGTANASSGPVPYVSVSPDGGSFTTSNLSSLFGNRSAELTGVSLSGLSSSAGTFVMACGNVVAKPGETLGDPKSTQPCVIGTFDRGATWKLAGPLPMPPGVDGAEAFSITFSEHAAYPGVLVAGMGWTTTGRHEIGIVWGTPDQGNTWRIISDTLFTNKALDVQPRVVAANGVTVAVAGSAVARSGAKRSETVLWTAASDGAWHLWDDRTELPAGRSSVPTSLIAPDSGGFVMTRETYDTAAGPFADGQTNSSAAVVALASITGTSWNDLADSLPGIGTAATVDGIAQFGSRVVLVGTDRQSHAQAWVMAGSDLP